MSLFWLQLTFKLGTLFFYWSSQRKILLFTSLCSTIPFIDKNVIQFQTSFADSFDSLMAKCTSKNSRLILPNFIQTKQKFFFFPISLRPISFDRIDCFIFKTQKFLNILKLKIFTLGGVTQFLTEWVAVYSTTEWALCVVCLCIQSMENMKKENQFFSLLRIHTPLVLDIIISRPIHMIKSRCLQTDHYTKQYDRHPFRNCFVMNLLWCVCCLL